MLSDLFMKEPDQWGLRGDPYLWKEMQASLGGTFFPESAQDLTIIIEEEFKKLTGYPITHQDYFFIERYDFRGMSSGYVSPEFWRDIAIPLLIKTSGLSPLK